MRIGWVFQQALRRLARCTLEGNLRLDEDISSRHYIFLGLADRGRITFDAIKLLSDNSCVDDAYALVRCLIETVINGAYVLFEGDAAADDYKDFPDYRSWQEFESLRKVAPAYAGTLPSQTIAEMKKAHDFVKHRYRGSDWSRDNFFKRAVKVDAHIAPTCNSMQMLVNIAWRKSSVYVHGTAESIAQRFCMEDGVIVIHRKPSEHEAAWVLFFANMAMFSLLSFLVDHFKKNFLSEWQALYDSWSITSSAESA
jgi:hypothetical protein